MTKWQSRYFFSLSSLSFLSLLSFPSTSITASLIFINSAGAKI